MLYNSVLDLIGNTPLVPIYHSGFKGALFAKLEGLNPGGSIKDRPALHMIRQALKSGDLQPGMTILEATSGNTGIGLALAGALLHIPVHIVMSESASPERVKILGALNARISFSPAELHTDGAIRLAEKIYSRSPEAFYRPDQFSNHANRDIHARTTAKEIWNDLEGDIDAVIAGTGSTGTLMGLSSFFKTTQRKVRIIGVRPAQGEIIDGIKDIHSSMRPPLWDETQIHALWDVSRREAIAAARRMIREEGIFAGISSGALYAAFLQNQRTLWGKRVVLILADNSFRYMESDLFDPSCITADALAPAV